MADDGRADCTHDRRFYALVLLTAFTSLRWGEATALRRADIDLKTRTGEMLIGPPKSKAGRRIAGIPAAIILELTQHLAIYVKDEPGALFYIPSTAL